MLIDPRAVDTLPIQALARGHQRHGQGGGLGVIHTLETDGHRQRRHLVGGDGARDVALDKGGELRGIEGLAVSLPLNEPGYVHALSCDPAGVTA